MSPAGADDRIAVLPDIGPARPIRIAAYGVELGIMERAGTEAQKPSDLDLIFSCVICRATVAQLYAEEDSCRPLRSTADSNKGVITKLWLTECGHVTCGKHLDGGGAPFHPEGHAPRAPCPLCRPERGEESPKALFAINGFKKGEHDSQIPHDYFLVPPMQLGGDAADLQAMRFQYLNLLRYGREMHATVADIERQMRDLELVKVANASKINWMEGSIAKQERIIKYWTQREPSIRHHLKAFTLMVQKLQEARQTLIAMNQDVSSIDQALNFLARPSSRATTQQQDSGIIPESNGSKTIALSENHGQSRLAQASAADLKALSRRSPASEALYAPSTSTRIVQTPQVQETSADKRKRIDSPNDAVYDQRYIPGEHTYQRWESRGAMPPPAKAPNLVSNVHAFASPRQRGNIHPTNRFNQLDVHAEHSVMAPALPYYAPQSNYLTGAQSQSLELGGDPRFSAVYNNHPRIGSNDQNGQYHNTGRLGAETFHVTPNEHKRLDGWSQFPEPRFEQRTPSTATLNQVYQPQQPQQPSFGQRAPSTATLNQSYLSQQSSFNQRAPSTATPNRSYPPQQFSLSDRRTATATNINTPFRGPTPHSTPRPPYPNSYTTNPHTASSTHHHTTTRFNDGELDHHYRPLPAHHPPSRRLTLPQTPTLARTGLLPHARSSTSHRQPLSGPRPPPPSAVASPFFGPEPRASTANPHLLNGLSFVTEPSLGAGGEAHSARRRRNAQR